MAESIAVNALYKSEDLFDLLYDYDTNGLLFMTPRNFRLVQIQSFCRNKQEHHMQVPTFSCRVLDR